jgi:hypothetical protein
LRLMDPIIAVLLAITMAIFPISMPRAAAFGEHGHAAAVEIVHEDVAVAADHHANHHDHADMVASCDLAAVGVCGQPESNSHDGATSACCGIGFCHAFQPSVAPPVFSPYLSAVPMSLARDEQVEGAFLGRLDRPPRTV